MTHRVLSLVVAAALPFLAPSADAQTTKGSAIRNALTKMHAAISRPIPLWKGSRILFNIAPRVDAGENQIVLGLLPRAHTPGSKAIGPFAITTHDTSSSYGLVGLSRHGTGNGLLVGAGGKDGNGLILGIGHYGTGRGLVGIGGLDGYGFVAYGDRGKSRGVISIPGM